MKRSNFYINSIVLVTNPKSLYYDQQGKVLGFNDDGKDGMVKVWFGGEADFCLEAQDRMLLEEAKNSEWDFCLEPPPTNKIHEEDIRTRSFHPDDLSVCACWTTKTLANRYYPGDWDSCFEPIGLLVPNSKPCEYKGCPEKATKRVVVNLSRHVFQMDVCMNHSYYDKKEIDSFPFRKPPFDHRRFDTRKACKKVNKLKCDVR